MPLRTGHARRVLLERARRKIDEAHMRSVYTLLFIAWLRRRMTVHNITTTP